MVLVLDDVPPLDGRIWKRLPNIHRLFVQQGTQFTDAHSETPACTPGRAGLLTGLHSQHHGAFVTNGSNFDPGETIATELRSSGYHTILAGKYLNIFDSYADKWPPGWSEFHGSGGGYYDYNLWSNGVVRRYGRAPSDYSTDVFARHAKAALDRVPDDKPLFLWLAPYSMHKPWTVAPRHHGDRACNRLKRWKPKGYMERDVRDKPAYVGQRRVVERGGYDLSRICRGMLSVDEMVGGVVKRLKKQGRLENTLLILTTDNGMAYGSQRFLYDKKAPYGTQIPLMLRWARVLGRVPKQVDVRVQNIDLAPTLCDIAGCELGPFSNGSKKPDGLSLLKLMTGERSQLWRKTVLGSYQDEARVPRYWSITTTGSSPLASKACSSRKKAGCRWQYTEYETGEKELYDLSNGPCYAWKRSKKGDPCMLKNKAGKPKYAEVERTLRKQLRRISPLS